MKSYLLFPNKFRVVGWLLFIPGFILGAAYLILEFRIPGFVLKLRDRDYLFTSSQENFTNELALTLVILGLMFIAFSKLKKEDELTSKLRLNALYWAILVNYIVIICLALSTNFTLGFNNVGEKINYLDSNLYVPLLTFISRFYYLLHKNKNEYYTAPLHFLPHTPYNKVARIVALPCIVLFAFRWHMGYGELFAEPSWTEYLDLIYLIFPIILLVWMYSKERMEDEYINSLRLQAMQIAVYINCVILLVANFVYYDLDFLVFELRELSVLPLMFVIIFQCNLYRLSRNTVGKKGQNLNLNTL